MCVCTQNFQVYVHMLVVNRQIEREKKRNVKEKEAGGVFPFLFQCSLTESNPSNIFSAFTSLLFDIDSNQMRTQKKKDERASNVTYY